MAKPDRSSFLSFFYRACDFIVILGIATLLLFTPLALGSTRVWAYSLMEGAVFFLIALWMGKLVVLQWQPTSSGQGQWSERLFSHSRFFLPLLLFVGFIGLQLVPLPAELLARLSPSTYSLYRHSLPGWPEHSPYREWLRLEEQQEKLEIENETNVETVGLQGEWLPLSIAPALTKSALLKILAYLGLFSLLLLYPVGTKQTQEAEYRFLRTVFVSIAASGFMVATIGVAQHFFWNGKILWFFVPEHWEGAAPDSVLRASGPFINSDHFANYLALSFPLFLAGFCSHKLFSSRQKARAFKILSAVGLFASFVGILLSLSRGGWMSTVVAVAILLWIFHKHAPEQPFPFFSQLSLSRSRQVMVVSIFFILVAFTFIGSSGRSQIDQRLEETVTVNSGLSDRLPVWQDSVGMVRDFPILGMGLGAWPEVFPRYQRPPWDPVVWLEPHNDYLQCLAETGLVGVGLVGWFFTVVVLRLWRGLRAATVTHFPLLAGIIAALGAMAFHEGFDFSLQMPTNALLFTAIVAVGLRMVGEPPSHPSSMDSSRWQTPLAVSVGMLAIMLSYAAITQEKIVRHNDADDFVSVAEARENILAFPARADGHAALFGLLEDLIPLAERMKELEIALWLTPLNPEIRDQYVVALLEQGQPEAALREVQQSVFNSPTLTTHFYLTSETVPQLDPPELQAIEAGMVQAIAVGFANAGMGLGGFYTRLNRFSEAGETYAKAAGKEPRERYRVRLLFEAARAYTRAGEGRKAEFFFRQVCQLTPNDPVPYQVFVNEVLVPRGAITEAKAIVNEGIQQGAPPMVLLMSLAEAVRRAGKIDEAKSILQEVLRRYPRTVDAHVRLGRLFLQEQNFDRAVLTLYKAIELQENSVSALDLLGQAEEGRKQFGAAEKAYATVLRLDPDNTSVRQRYLALQQRLNGNDPLLKGKRQTVTAKDSVLLP